MLRAEQVQGLLGGVATTLGAVGQDVLSLRYGVGLANLEIAETLKISANAVAVRVHRALSRLRAAIEDTAEAENWMLPRRDSRGRSDERHLRELDRDLRRIVIQERCSYGSELRAELVGELARLDGGRRSISRLC